MRKRLSIAAVCGAIALTAFLPADARVIPAVLECTASGSGRYLGDWEGSDAWTDIAAEGTCVGGHGAGDSLDVTLTGDGRSSPLFDASFDVSLRLVDPNTGKQKIVRQEWHGVSASCQNIRTVILASTKAPVGAGRARCGYFTDDFSVQGLAFSWTYLAFVTP